ncbi:unnamed protein product [Cylindrotheca closterium]|uniref:NAD(P)-binding domain-containing protein n=1 Tax=Cylindrotheca closterium TaxID=2856 RepID=A0AAD2CBC4_9STRA|nr:unnamed protein product [Cylindrotheca closterium]
MTIKVLVVGATGATGKHVVQMMLDAGHEVVAIARSKESMLQKLKDDKASHDKLEIREASIMEMKQEELVEVTKDCNFVVSCLGHNMSFKGMYLQDRKLVTEAAKRLTKAMPSSCKFILMGSDGVAHHGVDPPRSNLEGFIIFMLRYLVPPHADNEGVAAYLLGDTSFDWVTVRPTNLVNEEEATGKYNVTEKVEVSLFGDQTVSRNNVAHFMVELMTKKETFSKYLHKMPVVVDIPEDKPSTK